MFKSLFGSSPIEFVSDFPVEEAVVRLGEATVRSVYYTLVHQAAVGLVSRENVSLQRYIPFVGNSFKPFFVGNFEVEDGKTILRGEFSMHWTAKVFMGFWFGSIGLFSVFALLFAFGKPAERCLSMLVGIGMFAAGFAFVRIGQWFARNDRQFLVNVMTRALWANVIDPTSQGGPS